MSYIVREYDQRDGLGDEPVAELIVRDEDDAKLLMLALFLEHWRSWQSREEWDPRVNAVAEHVIAFAKTSEEGRLEDAWDELNAELTALVTQSLFPFSYSFDSIDGAPANGRQRMKQVLSLIKDNA